MADVTIYNKFAVVAGDEIVLDEFYEAARIETPHTVHTFDTDEQRVTFIASMGAELFPPIPEIGEWCEMNKVYQYGTDKAKCLQGHNRTIYPIEQTPALWLIIPTVVGYPVWVQPTGAHDAYHIGDRVHFPAADSPIYESLINANVWSPTAYPQGWLLIQ